MALAGEYRRQLQWRAWDRVLEALPPVTGSVVFDLGCAIGDQAALLAERGASVVGFDANEELLAVARGRGIPNATFVAGDLRDDSLRFGAADGLWCSFAAAYFPDFGSLLSAWIGRVKPGGWLAVTEIDDLFGHEPLSAESRLLLDRFAGESLAAGRYDFRMGSKLERHISSAGFQVARVFTVPDAELSFDGPAAPEVVTAWRERFDRLPRLREMCGPDFAGLRDEFLGTLGRSDHRSTARVCCVIARRPA
jgi:SAM-dependent methyltransferase